eukprot:2071150-Prymnesium_polylepis.1
MRGVNRGRCAAARTGEERCCWRRGAMDAAMLWTARRGETETRCVARSRHVATNGRNKSARRVPFTFVAAIND